LLLNFSFALFLTKHMPHLKKRKWLAKKGGKEPWSQIKHLQIPTCNYLLLNGIINCKAPLALIYLWKALFERTNPIIWLSMLDQFWHAFTYHSNNEILECAITLNKHG
jgi:hypothetical protein